MSLASSSNTAIRYVPEVTFGVNPGTACKALRITGESLKYAITKTESKEINQYRSVSSTTPTDASASGDLNGEMQYGEYDNFLAATLQSTFVEVGTDGVSAAISATFTATTIAGTGVGTGLVAGQFFTVTGTGQAALDNVLFRCDKTVAPTANLITLDTSTPGIVGGPYAATLIKSARLTNGSTQTSYTIERESVDIAEFFAFKGMTPDKASISIGSGSLSTINFSFMGKNASRAGATTLGATTASLAFESMSGVSGTSCAVWANGIPLTGTDVKSIKFDYSNALRAQGAICTLGAVAIGSGNIDCKVSLEIYFASGAKFFSDFTGNTEQELVFTAFDNAGNGYVFTLPTANVMDYTVNAGGQNADMMVTVNFTALRDAGNATSGLRQVVFIDRVGAAVTLP